MRDGSGQVLYMITSTADRSVYKLWVPTSDGWMLWGKNKSAGELARKYDQGRQAPRNHSTTRKE